MCEYVLEPEKYFLVFLGFNEQLNFHAQLTLTNNQQNCFHRLDSSIVAW